MKTLFINAVALLFSLTICAAQPNSVKLDFFRSTSYNQQIANLKIYVDGKKVGKIKNDSKLEYTHPFESDSAFLEIELKGGIANSKKEKIMTYRGDFFKFEVGFTNNGKIYMKQTAHYKSSLRN